MIIVGLGNPGKEYEQTRHNVGFLVVEKLAEKLQAMPWKLEYGVRWIKSGPQWLIEPWQYMNTSGPTLKTFLEKKVAAIDPPDLLVVHDDVDFPLGDIHEQFDRSGAGHNGIQSVIDVFGKKFSRIRIGIGSNRSPDGGPALPAEDYVLQKFSAEEQVVIDQAVDRAVGILIKKFSE